jgi:hypothetical protein
MANELKRSLKISLPEVLHGEASGSSPGSPPAPGDTVLLIYINFADAPPDINGYIAMLLRHAVDSDPQRACCAKYIQRVAGDFRASAMADTVQSAVFDALNAGLIVLARPSAFDMECVDGRRERYLRRRVRGKNAVRSISHRELGRLWRSRGVSA